MRITNDLVEHLGFPMNPSMYFWIREIALTDSVLIVGTPPPYESEKLRFDRGKGWDAVLFQG